MTSTGFVIRQAWRDVRAARRRLGLLTASVTAGVAALVAVNSFTDNLRASIGEQAQALLGADLSLTARKPVREIKPAQRLVDSVRALGRDSVIVATSASFPAMAFQPTGGGARLVQVRSVDPGWPFYGTIETSPAGIWSDLQHGGAIVDPSLLGAIGAQVGDSIGLGEARFKILGTVVNVPGDVGLQMSLGARVFIATSAVERTRLLGFGARADWETFLRLPSSIDAQRIARGARPALRADRVRVRTIADDRDSLTNALTRLGNYLGLVALAALLLGGLGVASAVHVFIRQRLDTIAVLRCLGATINQVFAIHLLQAVGMGLLGSVFGAILGIGLQQAMPMVLAGFIPSGVRVLPSPRAIAIGMSLGVWTAMVFALLPLLAIRDISPLATLRRDTGGRLRRFDRARLAAMALIAASVIGLATVQVGSWRSGAGFAIAIGVAIGVLWITSVGLIAAARRWTPAWLPYLGRQGLANLHRPANQTVTVVLALGFGAFLLTTLFVAQHNLLRDLRIDQGTTARPNLVLFDIQGDQRALVDSALRSRGVPTPQFTPIVPMRLLEVRGRKVRDILARGGAVDTARRRDDDETGNLWAYRREYRSTYRAVRGSAERVTAGKWFDSVATHAGLGRSAADPVPISVEADLAAQLSLHIGDQVTWDVQGVPVYSKVTSLREVNWARFEPNFFVVFAPGALDRAPQSWVTLLRTESPDARGRLQRFLAERAPNITSIDLGEVQRAVEAVIDRIVLAIRFMAFFSLATGTVVLFGAITTSRWQRIREGTLLRTLGATRKQVLTILSVEYAALGLGAALVAIVLASGAGWALAHWVFDATFRLPLLPMSALAVGLLALTTGVGLWNSLEVLQRPPLEVLRSQE